MVPAALDADPLNFVNRFWSTSIPMVPDSSYRPAETAPGTDLQMLDEPSPDVIRSCRELYNAARAGDWESAQRIFRDNPNAMKAQITLQRETALHVATSLGRVDFVKKLVEEMTEEDLAIPDYMGRTALHYAAIYGSIDAVKALVKKNSSLTQIMDNNKYTPLVEAAYYCASEEVLRFLAENTTDEEPGHPFTGPSAGELMRTLTTSGFYNVCFDLLDKYPSLATATNKNSNGMLTSLARKTSQSLSGSKLGILGRCMYHLIPVELNHEPPNLLGNDMENPEAEGSTAIQPRTCHLTQVLQCVYKAFWKTVIFLDCFKWLQHIKDEKYNHKCIQGLVRRACEKISEMNEKDIRAYFSKPCILHLAADVGGVEVMTICLQYFPYLIRIVSKKGGGSNILRTAVEQRQEKIFNLMLEKNVPSRILGNASNDQKETLLHLAAKLAPYPQLSSVSCPALQMQRELQWFKAVEKFVHPVLREGRNKNGLTPRELFTSEHKELLKDAEKWMRDTSTSCMVVSTLIATVAFAAALNAPGRNVEGKVIFLLFAVSDALALLSSTTSISMFLSILTARYAEDDFLHSLPRRLMFGFSFLFLTITAMMVAFGATLYSLLSERFKWKLFQPAPIAIGLTIFLLAAVPVAVFLLMQLPIVIYLFKSTIGSGIFQPRRIWK